MTVAETVRSRYAEVMDRVANAAVGNSRRASDVMVVAISKYAELDDVRELLELGHIDFGESRTQQLVQRASIVEEWVARRRSMRRVNASATEEASLTGGRFPNEVRWHMIGHLQRNKAKKTIEHVRLVHSVDSLRLIEEIQTAAMKLDTVADVLVQVNCSGEKSKYGCAVAAASHLAEQMETMMHIRARGVMTMAPHVEDPEDARDTFYRCVEVYNDISKRGIGDEHFNILSMGMSNDYEVAIDCGSNLVRLGGAIFGPRKLVSEEDGEDESGN